MIRKRNISALAYSPVKELCEMWHIFSTSVWEESSQHWSPGITNTEDTHHRKDCCQSQLLPFKCCLKLECLNLLIANTTTTVSHKGLYVPAQCSSSNPVASPQLWCSLGRWLLELYHVQWCIFKFMHQAKDLSKSILLSSVYLWQVWWTFPYCLLTGWWRSHLVITMIVCFQVMLLFEPDKI